MRLLNLTLLLCLTTPAMGGCNFLAFVELEDDAPVRSFESAQAEFGGQIAVFTDATEKETWVAASSYGVARYLTYQIYNEDGFNFPDGQEVCDGCDSNLPKFESADLAFAGVSDLTRGTEFCVVTPFNGEGAEGDETGLSIACDRPIQCGANEIQRCTVRGEISQTLGAAAAGVFGVDALQYAQVLLSDPKRSPYLFRLNNDSIGPVEFASGEPSSGFGDALISKTNGSLTRFAGSSGSKVQIFDLGSTGAILVGCADVGAKVNSLAWINDDIAVGSSDVVRVLEMSAFTTECASVSETGITCADLPTDSYSGPVLCGGLGNAIGAADVDGDGSQELLLGAPQSEVADHEAAGAVFVVPDGGASPIDASVLVDTDPKIDQKLGASVVGIPVYPNGKLREEIAAGAPGAQAWRLFLCSGQDGDNRGAANRCVP